VVWSVEELLDVLVDLTRRRVEKLEDLLRDPVIRVDARKFDRIVGESRLAVVDFWAEWCAPCLTFDPVFTEAAKKFMDPARGIVFLKVDVDEAPSVADRYYVESIPTVIIFEKGRPVDTIVGAVSYSFLERVIEKHLKSG
jgi:thioredoxin 1